MNKEKATQELKEAQIMLAEAQARIAKAEEELNKPARKSLLEKPEKEHWSIAVDGTPAKFTVDADMGLNFKECPTAVNYYRAFKTMIALRECEGSVSSTRCQEVFFALLSEYGLQFRSCHIALMNSPAFYGATASIFPLFDSEQSLADAVNTVGRENIIHMFKTLGHFEENV